MKKFFSLMFAAAAMFMFTACDKTDDMTDEELEAAIIDHAQYTGQTKSDDEDYDDIWLSANFNADKTYAIYWGEKRKDVRKDDADVLLAGKWKVLDGKLLMTDYDDEVEEWFGAWTLSKSGKRISYNGPSFSVELD